MFPFFETIFVALDRHDNHVIIVSVFLILAAVLIILRIGSHLHFRGALFAFYQDTKKPIAKREDVGLLKNRLLRKIVSEYIRIAERAVTVISTRQVVEREIARMGFFGWRYDGVFRLIEGMETGLLFVGIILALVFDQFTFVYGLMSVIVFVIMRLIVAFFNVREAHKELTDEIILFIEREIGRFFVSDSGGAILRLKNDLTEAIDRQASTYKTTMENIGKTMASTMTEVTGSMIAAANSIGPIVATAMDEKLLNMNDQLKNTLADWEKALSESSKIQTDMNTSSERLAHAGGQLQAAAELLATHMKGHSGALSEQLFTLVSAIDAVKIGIETLTEQQETLAKHSEYIENNQQNLEKSLTAYQDSLQNLTQSLGESLGAYINLHAQTSAQTINDALRGNIDRSLQLLNTKQN
ncbi:MAG: hypothetical protein FWE05_07185 [Defluviitaleaceae bacterium]|nr:hypothetical protein [Defluviitaleaceae bacterium]